ncbi:putative oleosin [Helianthus debilis subsp. tardiflorus]
MMAHNQQYSQQHQHHQPHLSHQVVKTATAVTLCGSLMVLSGLTLAATVIGLVVATPLLVIFSPVLVPVLITLSLIFGGFFASGGLGATASFVFYWMYRYVTGKHPVGSRQLDMARDKIAGAAMEARHKAEQLGHQTGRTTGVGQGHQIRVEHQALYLRDRGKAYVYISHSPDSINSSAICGI